MSFDTARIDWNPATRVGQGRFGIVVPYKEDPVDDPKGDKWVVKYADSYKPQEIMMTLQEIVVGSKCNHPNILPLKSCFIDVERGKWHMYIKLPRMKTTLEKYQDQERKNKPFTQDEIIKYFFGIVSGLEQLHLHKIAHRDIKPANILLDDEGQVKLTDFGVIVDVDGKTSMMISNQAGSKTYMAPEVEIQMQLKHKELFKADMWSVGVTMAKLCLGAKFKPVEDGDYPLATKEDFINKSLTELEGVYDPMLLNLIKTLVRQNPESRRTVKEVREILQAKYADILGVEEIEIPQSLLKKEELSVDETPKQQSAEENKSGDDAQLVKQISGPKSEKKEGKAQLEKIEEKLGEETGSITFMKSKPETKEEKIEIQKAAEIQAEEVQTVRQVSRQKAGNNEEKEAQQVNSRAENEEPKSSEKMVPQRLLNKDSQASESVEEKKIDEPKKNNRSESGNTNEKAELDELKEMKKHLEGLLKKEFTFKAVNKTEKDPVRFIIESKDPDKINDNVLTKLITELKKYKDGETFNNLQGISVILLSCNENLNRGIRQLITDICVNCQNLTFLVLSFMGSTKNVNDLLLKHISSEVSTKLSNLEYLGLFFDECDQITEQGVGWISNGLVSILPELKTLKLNFNACAKISNDSINQLCQKIGQYLSGLETLELYLQECVELEDDTIKGVGVHFKSLKNLNNLVLSLTNCTRVSSPALLDLSKKIGQYLKGLTSLHLAVCGLEVSNHNQSLIRKELEGISKFALDI